MCSFYKSISNENEKKNSLSVIKSKAKVIHLPLHSTGPSATSPATGQQSFKPS